MESNTRCRISFLSVQLDIYCCVYEERNSYPFKKPFIILFLILTSQFVSNHIPKKFENCECSLSYLLTRQNGEKGK